MPKRMKRSAGTKPGNSKGSAAKQSKSDEAATAGAANGNGSVSYLLKEALECQVCLDVAVSPIYSCFSGGHILCSICHDKLVGPRKCPSCSSYQKFLVNPALERMAQKLEHKMPCINVEAGCTEEVLSTNFKQQLKKCFFRDISCTLQRCNNAVVVKFKDWMAHLRQTHNIMAYHHIGLSVMVPVHISANYLNYFHFQLQFFRGHSHFILRMQMTETSIYFWMVVMGDDNEAKQHVVTISIFGKYKFPRNKPSTSWTLQTIPYHEDPQILKDKSNPLLFGSMAKKLFVPMVDTIQVVRQPPTTDMYLIGPYTETNFKFQLKVEIMKAP